MEPIQIHVYDQMIQGRFLSFNKANKHKMISNYNLF